MATPVDALLALRTTIKAKSPITYTDASSNTTSSLLAATHLRLSERPYPKSSPTRLRKPGITSSDPISRPQDFFTLEAVYLAWKLREASGAEYMKQARENGLAVGFVSVTERKSVVDWLEGRVADLERISPISCASLVPMLPCMGVLTHLVIVCSRIYHSSWNTTAFWTGVVIRSGVDTFYLSVGVKAS